MQNEFAPHASGHEPGIPQPAVQAPAPSQLLGPHPLSGSVPTGRLLQVPAFPASAHETHAPTQAVLQHTPSTQLALAHWLALLHEDPNVS